MLITTTIRHVIWSEPGKAWRILATDAGTAKGPCGWDVQPGERVKLDGEYKTSKFNGSQEFVFKSAMIDIPEDARALLDYAVSITDGMGPTTAAKIWEKYGADWPKIADPEIKGLRGTAKLNWRLTLDQIDHKQNQAKTVAFLIGRGCTMAMAMAAWEAWKDETFAKVSADVYCLADLPRYGFKAIDGAISQAFGIANNDPRRYTAATLYAIKENATTGNTFTTLPIVLKLLQKHCPDAMDHAEAAIEKLVNAERLVREADGFALVEDWTDEHTISARFANAV